MVAARRVRKGPHSVMGPGGSTEWLSNYHDGPGIQVQARAAGISSSSEGRRRLARPACDSAISIISVIDSVTPAVTSERTISVIIGSTQSLQTDSVPGSTRPKNTSEATMLSFGLVLALQKQFEEPHEKRIYCFAISQ